MMTGLNKAMNYIENCLPEEVDIAKAAGVAGCSEYHFRRIFSFLAGMPLGEYIRRRKLSMAGKELSLGREKVIDVALRHGYESPEAFSKAFQLMHGVSPSEAKKNNVILKEFSPMVFQLAIKGGIEMNYRIVAKPDFYIAGFKKRITVQYEGVNHQIDSLTERLTPDVIMELKSYCDIEPQGILNVSCNFADRTAADTELDQYLGVATTKLVSGIYDVQHVKASDWVVFSIIGTFPKAVQETWAKIYAEWLPTSGFELVEGPEILWNEGPDFTKTDFESEIWIPICKRA